MIKKVYTYFSDKLQYLNNIFINFKFWYKFILNDKDYDYYYIYEILKIKLRKQAFFIKNFGYHEDYEDNFRYMMLCYSLINKLQSEFYLNEWLDYYDSEIIIRPFDNYDELTEILDDNIIANDMIDIKVLEKVENLKYYYRKYPRIFMKLRKEISDENFDYIARKDLAMKISIINHNKAKRLLFKILEEKIETWWD